MIDEQLEFQVAQYADGSLPESERALVELRLLSNAEARALLEEYRALDQSLKSSMPLPPIDWDRLADHLSEAVAERSEERSATVLGRIGTFGRLAIAACVVLAVGGVALWTSMKFGGENAQVVHSIPSTGSNANTAIVTPPETRPAPLVVVRGPAPEAADAEPVVVVSVGPSSQVTPDWRAAEGVVTGPSRAIWIASTYDGAQDTQRLPY
ncbi:MAG TPA: hypothetical protein VGR35_03895 [Tepidisphaeraceae bacterium]|nr:hypothetical protein [Tepidisphaeraceae bacterium]